MFFILMWSKASGLIRESCCLIVGFNSRKWNIVSEPELSNFNLLAAGNGPRSLMVLRSGIWLNGLKSFQKFWILKKNAKCAHILSKGLLTLFTFLDFLFIRKSPLHIELCADYLFPFILINLFGGSSWKLIRSFNTSLPIR